MAKRLNVTFDFPPELGARLNELRRRAGLSLEELAHVMGRKSNFAARLSRLEHGRVKYPTLSLVADYLRACRASFTDIAPFLNRYTGRLPVRDTRARETALSGLGRDRSRDALRLDAYDRKTEAARKRTGQKPVPPEVRRQALARQLGSARDQRALERAVEDEVNRLGVPPTLLVRKMALDYGRMVWRALERTRTEPGPRPAGARPGRPRKTREQRLADIEARVRVQHGSAALPAGAYRQLRARVEKLFEASHPRWRQG